MTDNLTELARQSWDAIVLGAGPAGSLTARELARMGLEVLLVERKAFPRAKVCGACLNGRALTVLEAVGLDHLADRDGVPLECLALGMAGQITRLPLPSGVALSRPKFDLDLVEAARAAGVSFLPETSGVVGAVNGVSRRVGLTRTQQTVEAEARAVVVAAGLGSRALEGSTGFTTKVARGSRLGAGCAVSEYPAFYEPGTIFMAVGRRGYVGMVRVEDGRLNVASAFAPGFLKRAGGPAAAAIAVLAEARMPAIPALADASWLGTLPLTRRVRPVAAERLFLVGDATGYIEPFTGEGMAWALAGAVELAPFVRRAVDHWEPSLAKAWIARHRRTIVPAQRHCHALAELLHHPWLARTAFELAAILPNAAALLIRRINRAKVLSNPQLRRS